MTTTAEPTEKPGALERSTGVTNPLVLIEQMIAKGYNADDLGKLLDLQERWERNQALRAYNAAMGACQAALKAVPRTHENKEKQSLYATLDDVQRLVMPIINGHGFSVSFSQAAEPTADGRHHVVMRIGHEAGHVETLHGFYRVDGVGPKGGAVMSAIQGDVSTHTYAQRDMLRMAFSIQVGGLDRDGEPVDTLLAEEIDEVERLLAASGRDRAKFLAWCQVGAVEEIRRHSFEKVRDVLRRAAAEAKAARKDGAA